MFKRTVENNSIDSALQSSMNVVIRTDASVEIGSGHFMRCLSLADQLRASGAMVSFISRELPGNLCGQAENKGFVMHRLPFSSHRINVDEEPAHARWLGVSWETDAASTQQILTQIRPVTWLIVDHYGLDRRWETRMRPFIKRIMVIDDLADRRHDCDLLLDQNLYPEMETRYRNLVPAKCRLLLGPGYALMRPEFSEARINQRKRDGIVKRILIFFGSSDPTNQTMKAFDAISSFNRPDISVDVVVGNAHPFKKQIQQRCSVTINASYYEQINNMAQLMVNADLAIGAGGTTTWERCFLGLPSITVIVARNQSDVTEAVAKSGGTWNLGWHEQVDKTILEKAIRRALDNPEELKRMSILALEIMGGARSSRAKQLHNLILKEQYVYS